MKYFPAFLMIALFFSAPESRAEETTRVTSIQIRKNYPGGIDESDLTVQPAKRITRKGEELETEHYDGGEAGHDGEGISLDPGD
jgi:hypothetical protein